MNDLVATQLELNQAQEILGLLSTHFTVKEGGDKLNRRLELWYAARSANLDSDAHYNPWFQMAIADNEKSLVCMTQLANIITMARTLVHLRAIPLKGLGP